jgi:hypothetical protein
MLQRLVLFGLLMLTTSLFAEVLTGKVVSIAEGQLNHSGCNSTVTVIAFSAHGGKSLRRMVFLVYWL